MNGEEAFDRLMSLLDYPMFVVTTRAGDELSGCLVGFSTQVSIDPPRFLVGLSKRNRTYRIASRADHLAVHLVPRTHAEMARLFGSETGDRVDKFAECAWHAGPEDMPILDDAEGWFVGTVLDRYDVGDHVGHLLEPVAGTRPSDSNSSSPSPTSATWSPATRHSESSVSRQCLLGTFADYESSPIPPEDDRHHGRKIPAIGGIAAELAAAGFTDAVEVGRGGSGVVYRCYQQSLGRSVAIKVLASDLDEDDRERFLREGYAMGALSGHPNIANILQVGVTESDRPFIVMPYYAMGSLAERVRREGRIAWPDALRIGVKLCGALETAHRTGTLHRDIKPANVLVNDYGEPQLSDFGTARIAGGYKTVTGYFTGTLSYTAPEVLAGNSPTAAADVYSLGATIYALIAGSPPHERKADEDLIAHYLRITSTPVPDLRPGGIPADVCAAIEKAM